ncbi:MAG TPA: hypothetical protein VK327_06145 [Candidatus Paceibacterota bacterium]|nr:hypothetical protein [Candidatus Paceibacterota bacterium]
MTCHRKAVSLVCLTVASLMPAGVARAYELNLGTNLPPVDIHGFVSQGFLYSSDYNYLGDSSRGSFRFTEAGLNAAINPFPRTRIAAQAFMFDVGGIGKYEPFLDYASVEYTFNDHLTLRGGRIRKPGGIYNHIQDLDLARTWVLLPQGMYDARWRDFSTSFDGGEVFGNVSLGKGGGLSYEVFGGLINVSKNGGVGRAIQNGLPTGFSLHSLNPIASVGEQLWWNTPVDGLRFGAMYEYGFSLDYKASAPLDATGTNFARLHADQSVQIQQYSVEYTIKNWTFQAEYNLLDLDGDLTTATPFGAMGGKAVQHIDSWYASAAYRFNKWMEAGAYYTEYYPDTAHRGGSNLATPSDGYQRDIALSLRLDPKDWWIFKVEGHYIRGTGLLNDNANNPDRNGDGWFMLAMKTTVSF